MIIYRIRQTPAASPLKGVVLGSEWLDPSQALRVCHALSGAEQLTHDEKKTAFRKLDTAAVGTVTKLFRVNGFDYGVEKRGEDDEIQHTVPVIG